MKQLDDPLLQKVWDFQARACGVDPQALRDELMKPIDPNLKKELLGEFSKTPEKDNERDNRIP